MRALLITHGRLGEELLNSAREVYDVDAPVDCCSNSGLELGELVSEITAWLNQADTPAVLLVDVGGGSCGVAALTAADGRKDTWVIGGINLPMVLTFLSAHDEMKPSELVAKMLDRALNAVDRLGD